MKMRTSVGVAAGLALAWASGANAAWVLRQVPLDTATNTANSGGGSNAAQLENITEGEDLLNGANGFKAGSAVGSATTAVINFARGGSGDFGTDLNFPTGNGTTDQDDFAVDAVGRLQYNTAGTYVFRVNSDDGFRLRTGVTVTGSGTTVTATGGTTYSEFTAPRGPGNTDGGGLVRSVGQTDDVRLTFFERGGGEEVELSYSLNGGAFQLVGAGSDITVITATPEPAALSLLSVGVIGLVRRRARRAV